MNYTDGSADIFVNSLKVGNTMHQSQFIVTPEGASLATRSKDTRSKDTRSKDTRSEDTRSEDSSLSNKLVGSIQQAIDRAVAAGYGVNNVASIYVIGGNYEEAGLTLYPGIHLKGDGKSSIVTLTGSGLVFSGSSHTVETVVEGFKFVTTDDITMVKNTSPMSTVAGEEQDIVGILELKNVILQNSASTLPLVECTAFGGINIVDCELYNNTNTTFGPVLKLTGGSMNAYRTVMFGDRMLETTAMTLGDENWGSFKFCDFKSGIIDNEHMFIIESTPNNILFSFDYCRISQLLSTVNNAHGFLMNGGSVSMSFSHVSIRGNAGSPTNYLFNRSPVATVVGAVFHGGNNYSAPGALGVVDQTNVAAGVIMTAHAHA